MKLDGMLLYNLSIVYLKRLSIWFTNKFRRFMPAYIMYTLRSFYDDDVLRINANRRKEMIKKKTFTNCINVTWLQSADAEYLNRLHWYLKCFYVWVPDVLIVTWIQLLKQTLQQLFSKRLDGLLIASDYMIFWKLHSR